MTLNDAMTLLLIWEWSGYDRKVTTDYRNGVFVAEAKEAGETVSLASHRWSLSKATIRLAAVIDLDP